MKRNLLLLVLFVLCGTEVSAGTETLYPLSLKSSTGKKSGQKLSVLAQKDQSGTADSWGKYIEFYPARSGYTGEFSFKATLGSITKLSLDANFKGLSSNQQAWQFSIYNHRTKSFVDLAGNTSVTPWQWSSITGTLSGASTDYMSSAKDIRIRFKTASNEDVCDLDYLALSVEGNSGIVPPQGTPARTPTPATPQPVETPTPVPPSPTPASTPASTPTPTPTPTPQSGSSWWKPKPGLSWDIQFTGNINYNVNVEALDIDLFDTKASTIASLHARGVKVICYFSAGSYEDWRPDADQFPSTVRGKSLDGWAGEKWLDVRNLDDLMPIMTARMNMAVQKKCDAVDLDNMDIYQHDSGFTISYNQNLAYAKALVKEAHKRNLAIGLKNNLDQIKDLVNDYDFAINESCYDYNECDMLKPFVQQGKPVLGIEYKKSTSQFCAAANDSNYDFLKKNQSLDQARQSCR